MKLSQHKRKNMKSKIFSAVLGICSLLWFVCPIMPPASAAGLAAYAKISPVTASAAADGKTPITIRLYGYQLCQQGSYAVNNNTACNDGSALGQYPVPSVTLWITVTGSDYTLSGTTPTANESYVNAGDDGYATFTITGTAVGSHTITVDGGLTPVSATVSFTTPVAATPTPVVTPKPVTTPAATSTPTPTPTPPAAPTTGVSLNQQTVSAASTPTVQAGKSITLAGTTVPNGVVTLYIFSTPRQATATANAEGKWSFSINGLEAGRHHVEATVTDPATTLTSDRVTLAAFAVAKPVVAAPVAKRKTSNWIWVASSLGAALIVGAIGVLWWYRRRASSVAPATTPDETSQPPTAPPQA